MYRGIRAHLPRMHAHTFTQIYKITCMYIYVYVYIHAGDQVEAHGQRPGQSRPVVELRCLCCTIAQDAVTLNKQLHLLHFYPDGFVVVRTCFCTAAYCGRLHVETPFCESLRLLLTNQHVFLFSLFPHNAPSHCLKKCHYLDVGHWVAGHGWSLVHE